MCVRLVCILSGLALIVILQWKALSYVNFCVCLYGRLALCALLFNVPHSVFLVLLLQRPLHRLTTKKGI